jgi:hypothetical protein
MTPDQTAFIIQAKTEDMPNAGLHVESVFVPTHTAWRILW